MAAELLLDTGALVSLLDRSQRLHADCSQVFSGWRGPVLTTDAVLTESTHLLGRVPGGPARCLEFVLSGGAILVPSSRGSLRRCQELMQQYEDLPMDYADATLVTLAEELGTNAVLTTDRRDFTVYRVGSKRRFRVLP